MVFPFTQKVPRKPSSSNFEYQREMLQQSVVERVADGTPFIRLVGSNNDSVSRAWIL